MCCKQATILVLNHNGKALLEEFLPSVVKAATWGGQRHDVIVVDNASSDGSIALLKRQFPQVHVRRMSRNRYLFSYNAAVRECETDVVVLLNNDVRVDLGFLPPLLEHFADDRVFAATPMVQSDKATERFECRRYPVLTRGTLSTRPDFASAGTQFTLFAHGGASAFDRKKFLALGGLDHLYWTCLYEDIDISYLAWTRGWRTIFEPRSVVFHRGGASLGRTPGRSGRWRRVEERVRTLFVLKNINNRRMLAECLTFLALRALRALGSGDLRRLLAHLDIALRWPQIVEARRRVGRLRVFDDAQIFAALRMNGAPGCERRYRGSSRAIRGRDLVLEGIGAADERSQWKRTRVIADTGVPVGSA
jgi:GT2 family glycosyltransferase